ncbi:ankyrin repeat-containing domain protein [Colletotrichum lupini]|nr:ankyrin repeat-containing domain protein [Colletotrichum lupini]
MGPPPRDQANEAFSLWAKKKEAADKKRHRDILVNKLGQWDEHHLGHDIHPTPDTCTWIQSHDFFKSWVKSNKTAGLFVQGATGCGKTYLAKSIANYLSWDRPRSPPDNNIVLSFFCNVSTVGNKKPPIAQYFVRSLLQLRPVWSESIAPYYRWQELKSHFKLPALFDILRDIMSQMQYSTGPPKTTAVFLIVDGLDDCDVTYAREFLCLVGSLLDHPVARSSPAAGPSLPGQGYPRETVRFKFLFTYSACEILSLNSCIPNSARILMTDSAIRKDIGTYVDRELDILSTLRDLNGPPEGIRSWIKNKSESFFWFAKYSIEDAMSTVQDGEGYSFSGRVLPCPSSLGKYYDRDLLPLFQTIDEDGKYALSAVQIVLGYLSIPTRAEICDAIACLHGDPNLRFLDLPNFLRQRCPRIIHSLDEGDFRISHPSLIYHVRRYYLIEKEQHANMAFLCIKYLSGSDFGSFKLIMPPNISARHPFYSYAANNWREHLRRAGDKVVRLLPLLGDFVSSANYRTWSAYYSWNIEFTHHRRVIDDTFVSPVFTFIDANIGHLTHEIQWAGRGEAYSWKSELLRQTWRYLYERKQTPVIARLIEYWRPDSCFSVHNFFGHTPLMHAAGSSEGQPDMVEYFLKRTKDVNERGSLRGGTALMILCTHLRTRDEDLMARLVTSLLDAGADPNISDKWGETPLVNPCSVGDAAMVELLLRAGARPDMLSIHTPIMHPLREAIMQHHNEVARLLIDYGVDLSLHFPWPNLQLPLTAAITEQNFDIFMVLLDRVEDINQLDGMGYAAIHLLTGPLCNDWLPHLLRRPDVDLELLSNGISGDRKKFIRRTALSFAIVDDNFKAVELLLEAGASPRRHPASLDETPLLIAVEMARTTKNKESVEESEVDISTGNTDIVELLLAYQSPINTLNWKSKKYAKSPLMVAVDYKDQNMVELLLRHGADPTLEEAYGMPGPLDAAMLDDEDIAMGMIKVLLENPLPPSINYVPDNPDFQHILIEASDMKPEVTRLLLAHGADTKRFLSYIPGCFTTPLHRAVEENNIETAKVLIEHEPALVTYQCEEGLVYETPLHIAARDGHIEILRCLLDTGAQSNLASCHWQETPLWLACESGRLEIAQLLYEMSPEALELPSYDGKTPLMVACEDGNLQLVQFLLEKGADITARCSMGASCVCSTVSEDNGAAYKIIDLSLQHGLGIDDVVSSTGFTVLGEACRAGDIPTVRLLLDKGADPAKGQKWPGDTSTTWRSALRVASLYECVKVVEVLLEHPQLASFIENVDYYGDNVLHIDGSYHHQQASEMATLVYSACEKLKAETGVDHFQRMLDVKDSDMHTPLDMAIDMPHKGLSSEAIKVIDVYLKRYIAELTAVETRTFAQHKHLMRDIAIILLERREYDEEAIRLFQALIVDVWVTREDGKCLETVFCMANCDLCDEDEQEQVSFCRLCGLRVGMKCVDEARLQHELVYVPVIKDRSIIDLNSESVNQIMDLLENDFIVTDCPRPVEEALISHFQVDPDSEDTTLSLAVLHAFGYLEFRRRAWSPYLPLAPAVYKRIQPWEPMFTEPRRDFEEWVWDIETSPYRLRDELNYLLESGRRVAYKDEQATRLEQILSDVGWLYPQREVYDDDDSGVVIDEYSCSAEEMLGRKRR